MKKILLALLLSFGLAAAVPAPADDLSQYERKADMNPDDPGSQFNWAVMAFKAKRFKPALKAISRVTALTPKDAVAWELKGEIALASGDEKLGMESLEKSVNLDSKRSEAAYQLAKLYASKSDVAQAKKYLNAYEDSEKKPKDLKRVLSQGVLWNKLGNDKRAMELFEKASKMEGGQAAAARYLCQLYNQAGDTKKAESYCEKAAAAEGANADIYYNLGFAQSRQGHKEAAHRSFAKAVAADPNYAPALYNLGAMDYESGNLDAALSHFKAALAAKNGDYPEAQYNVAVVLGEQGKWREAAGLYNKILKNEPGNEDAKTNLAYVVENGTEALLNQGRDAYESGNYDAAAKAWSGALELDPQNVAAKDFLKKVKTKTTAKQNSALAAKKEARKAVANRLKSEDEKVLKEGMLAFKAGKLSQAVRLLDFYVRKNPANKQASQTLFKAKSALNQQVDDLLQRAGRLLVDNKKDDSKALITQALALDPNSSRANKMLAQVTGSQGEQKVSSDALKKSYFEGVDAYLEGDLPKAIGIWKKVLAADPGHLDAQRSLSQAELELTALQKHK